MQCVDGPHHCPHGVQGARNTCPNMARAEPDNGAMARQGVGLGYGSREWDNVEVEAHQCSDGAAALRRGR
jgi:hypothetical protein